jgi:hypothetical protein
MTGHKNRRPVPLLRSDFAVRVLSGDGGLGFVEATLFEFLAAAAGATVVAAGFGAGAAIRLLCIFVQEIGILGGGLLGDGFLSRFWEGGSGAARLRGAGQGVVEDEDGGAEASGGGGFDA